MSQEQEHQGFAIEWRRLGEVAKAIGCVDQTLRNLAKAERLLTQSVKGHPCCQAFAAYDLLSQSRRPPENLKKPPGYGLQAGQAAGLEADDPVDQEITAALKGADPCTMDPHELARRLLAAGVAVPKVRLAVQISNAVQRRREGELRAGKNIPPDDVVKMLRSFCELFVEEIDSHAAASAAELMRLLRERYAIDLVFKYPSMAAQLEDFYRQQGQGVLQALRAHLDEQTAGQRLDFEQ